jgi:hypothetical protein
MLLCLEQRIYINMPRNTSFNRGASFDSKRRRRSRRRRRIICLRATSEYKLTLDNKQIAAMYKCHMHNCIIYNHNEWNCLIRTLSVICVISLD